MVSHPLRIPEIIESIAIYLPQSDLVTCLRVCKKFHFVLTPIVWSKISVCRTWRSVLPSPLIQEIQPLPPALDRLSYPTGQCLQRYKDHIQEIDLYEECPNEYWALRGLHLRAIRFNDPGSYYEQEKVGLLSLIDAHSSTLECIHFRVKEPAYRRMTLEKDFRAALARCKKLKELYFDGVTIPDDFISMFLQVGEGLHTLRFEYSEMLDWVSAAATIKGDHKGLEEFNHPKYGFVLPGPRNLTIIESRVRNQHKQHPLLHRQAMMIRSCINLESLQWKGYDLADEDWIYTDAYKKSDDDSCYFCNTLSMDPWPLSRLESLNLSWVRMKDGDLARLLNQIHQLKELNLEGTLFGVESFNAVIAGKGNAIDGAGGSNAPQRRQQLCDSIESLSLLCCSNVDGRMIQELLSSCHKLKAFTAGEIEIIDIANGEEWVCNDIKNLAIYISADIHKKTGPAEIQRIQRITYHRLAKLVKLEKLRFSHYHKRNGYFRNSGRTIDLKLEYGLDLLKDLKELRELHFSGESEQDLSSGDVQWMIDNWPKFICLNGRDPRTTPVEWEGEDDEEQREWDEEATESWKQYLDTII
ncbi:hypothetical protein BGX26_005122 [Mortierella sp. AD094]|nr:hypothetical protein BGX26_005122 [Mortierella sp. AD094]